MLLRHFEFASSLLASSSKRKRPLFYNLMIESAAVARCPKGIIEQARMEKH